jgi:DNA-directed RNA polymerase specialized sigma24 family protein
MRPERPSRVAGRSSNAADDTETTDDKLRRALDNLGAADWIRLERLARFFTRSRLGSDMAESALEAADLLQEALARTLAGQRRWNIEVPLVQHVAGVMGSVAGHLAAHRKAFPTAPVPVDDAGLASAEPDPLFILAARDQETQLFARFEDDPKATSVLRLRMEGYTAVEIRQRLHLSTTDYETIARRIRRRLATL